MNRREARVSINVRQNDALNEFENFKKKFLLANKHITKLNSTLSVRIEELNAHISALNVENLRLRASEIALSTQLQREREKTWRVMAEAEAATHNLTKHFVNVRKSLSIPYSAPLPAYLPQQATRARRPSLDPTASPPTNRISRAPNVPGIYEEEEEDEVFDEDRLPSPTIRRRTKGRLSASRLPLPARVITPPLATSVLQPVPVEKPKKKTSRRSGLLTMETTRPPSPAVGSPIQKLAQEAQEEDDAAAAEMDTETESEIVSEQKGKGRATEAGSEDSDGITRARERKRRRDEEEVSAAATSPPLGAKTLKDVTNSPRGRAALPLLDTNTIDRQRQHSPDTDINTAVSAAPSSLMPYASSQSTPATTPAQTPHPLTSSRDSFYLPTPRPSSSPVPPPDEADTAAPNGGRATRTRKSVNYAEPKLNTKMRKPDPEPGVGVPTPRKRSSGSTKPQPEVPFEEPAPLETVPPVPPLPKKRSSTSAKSQPQVLHSDDPEPRSSLECVSPSLASQKIVQQKHVQPQEIKSRPDSAEPPSPPRSTSRPSSSSSSRSFRPTSSSQAYVTMTHAYSTTAPTAAATTIKRKKSRPYVDPDDYEDSDGAQADAEFGGGASSTWINIEGRRKSTAHGPKVTSSSKTIDGDEGRRRSLAV
ncbi:hypothetical protein FIBSPDRAFT_934796 [Athelia psychrophila]|uniref:Shugoshin C-terminal domain-containing protein n=1 Tax=Athelia psychrophila TaxID=1759441 RepID=A0A166ESK9_9AGAM|nr:hypothetical protein FIBSPDRAFT_934796 [Fibularhizoctonia sp. CBS 109695]